MIIKLGAMGDVLRTTPLLHALKEKYAGCKITWLVDVKSAAVLERNPLIDELVLLTESGLDGLKQKTFDLSVNLDKEDEAMDALGAIPSKVKKGFGRSKSGQPCAVDAESDYAFRLGVDDDLKFRKNKKTYQQISFEQLGLKFSGQEYIFPLEDSARSRAREYLESWGVKSGQAGRRIVGLNTGSGNRFAGKKLPIAAYAELARKFHGEMNATVFLLGGEEEIERNKEIERLAKCPVVNTGSHSIQEFAAIVRECTLVISGDTIAMHVAIAVKVPVVAFFASTCAAEIELYGRGQKVVSEIPCAPCYLKSCPIDEQCMKEMSTEVILKAAKAVMMS